MNTHWTEEFVSIVTRLKEGGTVYFGYEQTMTFGVWSDIQESNKVLILVEDV